MKFELLALTAFAPLSLAALCDQYQSQSQGGYIFNNNKWGQGSGSGSQCLTVDKTWDGNAAFHADWSWSGSANNVKSYPYAGLEFSRGKKVSSIGSINGGADWDYSGSNIRANVAYDIFTSADPNHVTSSGDYELMIWLGKLGDIYPIGGSIGRVKAANREWDLHVGYNGAMKVFSFVAPSPVTRFDGNIMDFFYVMRDMQGYPMDKQYLLTLQFGTEPFTGSNARFNAWYFGAKIK
ncbi:hypothetical protein V2G26_007930 [Clonostachys chloroleuca]